MTNTKHTPGPWSLKDPTGSAENEIGVFNGERWIASVWDDKTEEGCDLADANARLIAAAPDLLEACNLLYARLSAHTSHVESCDLDPRDDVSLNQARSAIAKAVNP